jgi:hypothetical protein
MRFSYTRALYDNYVAPDLDRGAQSGEVLVDELIGSA